MLGAARAATKSLPAILIGVVLTLAPHQAQAQSTNTVQVEQSVSATYGTSLTFTMRASAATTLMGARLTIQVANSDKLYSESVPVVPGTTITASHKVTTESIQLPPFALLTYYWDFADDSGQEYRSEPQTMRYEDTSVPWQWAVVSQNNVVVHTDGTDLAFSNTVLDVATDALKEASRAVGVAVEDEIHVYVYPELAQLASSLRLHERQVQDWVAAYALPDQRIALVSAAPGPEQFVNLQRDLPHEITHLVVAVAAGENADSVPGWFNEGLALMSAPEPDATLYDVLQTATREGTQSLHPLETLCAPNFSSLPPRQAALAYAQSESVMRYVSDRYGTSQVRGLMAAYADGLSCEGGVELVLGITLTELEKQWHNNLGRSVAQSSNEEVPLLTWLIVWAISIGLALLFIAPQPYRPEEQPAYETKLSLPPVPDDSHG